MKVVFAFNLKRIFVILYFLARLSLAEDYETCTTPEQTDGRCVPIKECKHVLEILRKPSLSQKVKDYLMQSKCDSHQRPWVCCAFGIATRSSKQQLLPENDDDEGQQNLPDPKKNQCGLISTAIPTRITGGSEALIGEFPFYALLLYAKPNNRYGFHCGGSLISNRFVITAAHCADSNHLPPAWSLYSVRLGEYDRSQDIDCQRIELSDGDERICAPQPEDHLIEQILIHEQYRYSDKIHDIALLKLSESIIFSNFIKPACLLTDALKQHLNYGSVTVVGFGKTENANYSKIMLKTELTISDHRMCAKKYHSQGREIFDTQVCAFGHDRDSCSGDSGGGLFKRIEENHRTYWYLVGIVSFGPSKCGQTQIPGVYTNVLKYVNWIKEKTSQ